MRVSNWGRGCVFCILYSVHRQDKLFRTLEGFPISTGLKGGKNSTDVLNKILIGRKAVFHLFQF